MTGLTLNWPRFSFWFSNAEPQQNTAAETQGGDTHQDLRRAYVTEMMCSGACVGEFGAQALMAVFPKDF